MRRFESRLLSLQVVVWAMLVESGVARAQADHLGIDDVRLEGLGYA